MKTHKRLSLSILFSLFFLSTTAPALAVNDVYLAKGDNLPYYYGQILTASGVPVNLTSCAVTAYMVDAATMIPKVSAGEAGVITNTANGMFEYRWSTVDTATVGTYYITFTVSNGGQKYSVPTTSRAKVVVVQVVK